MLENKMLISAEEIQIKPVKSTFKYLALLTAKGAETGFDLLEATQSLGRSVKYGVKIGESEIELEMLRTLAANKEERDALLEKLEEA